MRRGLYWAGVLVAVALLAVGVLVAVLGYARTAGPDGAVRGYFAALARSDAPAALAFGDVPPGPHTLLTTTVLRDQQRIAPLRQFKIASTDRQGSTAIVAVTYTLAFPGQPVPVDVEVGVHQAGGDWRLNRVAVPTTLEVSEAVQRESIVGANIPAGQTLLFPGALPIRFDTPYLQLAPLSDSVSFAALEATPVVVTPTPAARTAMARAIRAKLVACLAAPSPDVTCPLPDERCVPGSVRGSVTGGVVTSGVEVVPGDPVGALNYRSTVAVTGTYRRLNFHNRAVLSRGPIMLAVHAAAYAMAPLQVRWVIG